MSISSKVFLREVEAQVKRNESRQRRARRALVQAIDEVENAATALGLAYMRLERAREKAEQDAFSIPGGA
jgi:hypothetical protein